MYIVHDQPRVDIRSTVIDAETSSFISLVRVEQIDSLSRLSVHMILIPAE